MAADGDMRSVVAPATFVDGVWRTGAVGMSLALAGALALLGWLSLTSADYLPYVPVAILGLVAAVILFQHPTINICVLLGGVVVTLNFEEGFQPQEVIYGLYFMLFMSHWFATRLIDRGLGLIESKTDVLLSLFLLYVTASFGLTALHGGDLRSALSEWVALSMLALYFPVREFCRTNKHGAKLVLSVLCGIGVFVAVRNGLMYHQRLGNAEHLYQIVSGRVMMNDNVLMVTALVGLVLLVFADRWRNRGLMLLLFLFLLTGLILTQSRTFWVAFAFGAGVILLIVERRYRRRLLVYGAAGLLAVGGVGMVFFGDLISIIFGAMIDRVASIGSAASSDISLRSRAYEAMGAWEHIKTNPVLGHGLGVQFQFFDIIEKVTKVRIFIHNGYVSLLYRFGVIGTMLLLSFWFISIKIILGAARDKGADKFLRIGAIVASISLLAFVLSANASNPFFLMDALFIFAVLTGLGIGCYERRRDQTMTGASAQGSGFPLRDQV